MRRHEARIKSQRGFRFHLGLLQVPRQEKALRLLQSFFDLRQKLDAPELHIDLFQQCSGFAVARVDLQGLAEQLPGRREILRFNLLLALRDELRDLFHLDVPPDGIELEQHFLHALEPLGDILAQHAVHQGGNVCRAIGHCFAEPARLLGHDVHHQRRVVLSSERPFVAHQFVEHHSYGPDVGTLVGVLALDLLRRHVAERADQHAGLRARSIE